MAEDIIGQDDSRSVIYYQKTPDRLLFATNPTLINSIIAWRNTIVLDKKTIDILINSDSGTPNLIFDFIFEEEQHIYLRVYHRLVQAGFGGSCYGVTTDLVEREQQRYHPRASVDRNIIIKLDRQMYDSLQNWQHWVDEEALTNRYIYRFTDNSTYDLKWLTVYDLNTTESICIAYNSWTGEIFVNKSLPEILGADWWTTM